ncbi:hypothetical protein BDP27DRAFT_1418394 [Rhodocollybia butyracea]|uniref:DUF6533 domain-containing protein n=1 Tax=Rhodocollybia butyracea TaxID=206335 RepID=A0A9P5UAH5_9AGAR|nr:hypothetical protein BDP27DRAFT_1418394 [Rhodocollybia butyracea]
MSSSQIPPAALQEIFSELSSGRIAISAGYAAATLTLYDLLLTLSSEATKMWQPKKTLVFPLFLTLRYATILYQITFSMSFFLPFTSSKGYKPPVDVIQISGTNSTL